MKIWFHGWRYRKVSKWTRYDEHFQLRTFIADFLNEDTLEVVILATHDKVHFFYL